ncbi:hypothetical protein BV898_19631 [Hypsibius exemplaris]|uniref:Uncharacterized protein n=1 Tax=Hypsibius exemplaris TaxID=2072580 RepID=A0A9X6NLT8_HYPEX|nr:hypothetical protein BV898_19631 [Hypsibius exemplaris]
MSVAIVFDGGHRNQRRCVMSSVPSVLCRSSTGESLDHRLLAALVHSGLVVLLPVFGLWVRPGETRCRWGDASLLPSGQRPTAKSPFTWIGVDRQFCASGRVLASVR